jgi:hypothetical protein
MIKEKRFIELKKLIDYHIAKQLNSKQENDLYKDISDYLNAPVVDDFKLEVIAVKVIQLGANYESFVSSLLFKSMPEDFTRKELQLLEEELYHYIEKDLYGRGMDKRFTTKLIEQTLKLVPNKTEALTKKKAIGNWGWLIPHALMQVIVEAILKKIQTALLEDKRINRKGRIRIKKM